VTTRIGILGGTFDPIHLGHAASAHSVAARFELARVLLLLSARPPHKPSGAEASVEQRLAMATLLAAADPLLEACDLEVRRSGPSYTYDSLRELECRNPDAELVLIMGIDAYLEIDTWHRAGDLLAECSITVTTRPGFRAPPAGLLPPIAARNSTCYDSSIGRYVHSSGHFLVEHELDGLDISSSDIRRRVREGKPVAHLTGSAVADYIAAHKIYGAVAS